ncbi:cytochrome b/b6 domain-containing protein [Microbulbifer discodermiae]|uniref:cytochrome b/b6 domain-containing protein n=1 Tax=Microbulbifer sp. 2201CG32-9 TaxID=3232309 RepID=UPI00345B751B
MFRFVGSYFDSKFSPVTKYLHFSLVVLVILQIVISNFMEINADGTIGQNVVEYFSTWLHIGVGLLVLGLSFIFVTVELNRRGFLYFFPYFSGNFHQLKSDINRLKKAELPESAPGGLAAIVQGLGFGAILCVATSGCIWFILWLTDVSFSDTFREIHEMLTGLIEAYIVGHGLLGVIHITSNYLKRDAIDTPS